FIASQLIAEEKRTKSYYFIVFVSGLAGIIGAGFAFSVPWTQLDVSYNQQFFIKLAFLFSFILVLSTNSKFRAEIGFQNWMKILAPVMVVIWSMSGLLVTSQWKEGLDRLREIQARRPGCQLIEDLNEKRFLMERGINVSSSQYISLLLNGSWTITSIVFFADFQDPTNNLCEVKTWTSGVKYLGSESWANSSAPWLAMPLIERQFDFSHFFETPK
ncbi:MAG: hypothetical protein IT289_11350, partial [Oligoflexia bacterium]|nr:hypothetical protein [Oligoflexia bacterium]